jgi:hypothetical protein
LFVSNSAKIQPIAHTSTPVEYVGEPKRSSGQRYHRVTTMGVYRLTGEP